MSVDAGREGAVSPLQVNNALTPETDGGRRQLPPSRRRRPRDQQQATAEFRFVQHVTLASEARYCWPTCRCWLLFAGRSAAPAGAASQACRTARRGRSCRSWMSPFTPRENVNAPDLPCKYLILLYYFTHLLLNTPFAEPAPPTLQPKSGEPKQSWFVE